MKRWRIMSINNNIFKDLDETSVADFVKITKISTYHIF